MALVNPTLVSGFSFAILLAADTVRARPIFTPIFIYRPSIASLAPSSFITVTAIKDEWWGPLKKAFYVFPIFYHLSSAAAKSAALLLYIRMASAHVFLRYASYAVLAMVDIAGIVLVFLNIFVSLSREVLGRR